MTKMQLKIIFESTAHFECQAKSGFLIKVIENITRNRTLSIYIKTIVIIE